MQFIEQFLGCPQIARVKPLREPPVNRSQQFARLPHLALVAPALVALGERLRDTATDVSDLARPIEPHSAAPLHGLRSRAFSLRQLLRGSAWQGPSVAPLVPRLAGEQTERVPLRKVTA